MTTWVSIIASALTILSLGLGWWVAGAKRRKVKADAEQRERMRRALADRDASAIDDELDDLGV